jgi:hypothetical protein
MSPKFSENEIEKAFLMGWGRADVQGFAPKERSIVTGTVTGIENDVAVIDVRAKTVTLRGIQKLDWQAKVGDKVAFYFERGDNEALPLLDSALQEGRDTPSPANASDEVTAVDRVGTATANQDLYTPNAQLVDILQNGLLANYEIVRGRAEKPDEIPIPSREYSEAILAPRILEVIASRARRIALGATPLRPLIYGDRFDYETVVEICVNVPIRLDDATTFFELLRVDLFSWLRSGRTIGGSWGRLSLTEHGIDFELTAPEPQLAGKREKPSSFEWR